MNEKKAGHKFSINVRIRSFLYACNGLKLLWKEEHNARVHVLVSIIVILFGFYFNIDRIEWFAIIIAIGSVLAAECFNSALESMADYSSPEFHSLIKKAKDFAAAAVLILAIMAAILGLIVFIPYVVEMF